MSYIPEVHSSGPWTIQQLESEHHGYTNWPTYAVRSLANVCVAIVGDVDHYESERIPANAQLIAGAPDLLEALKEARRALHTISSSGPLSDKRIALLGRIDTAIANATKGE